jgi:hypothetical protein
MSRRELIERVLTGLPAGSDPIAYPDHPFLLQGPDVLALTNGSLTAYFVFAERARRLTANFLSNVVLSRLALPRDTGFVLILGEEARLGEHDWQLFEQVVEVPKRRDLRIPAERTDEPLSAQIIEPLMRPHYERFAQAWASTAGNRRLSRRMPGEPTSARPLRDHPPRARYVEFRDGEFTLPQPDPASRQSIRTLLSKATRIAVRADYWLDLGVPGIGEVAQLVRSQQGYLALHRNQMPLPTETHQFDALKPFRAAAFAGFATSRSS